MTQVDPEDIAQRAAQRDPDAFTQVYDEHVDTVYRYIYFKVSDGGVAEDLTSEVFVKAWERIDRFQWRNVPLQNWLLRIARNIVIDYYRSRPRRLTSPLDELGDSQSDEPTPEEHLARDSEHDALRRGLAQLPDDQRDVLILRFVEGYSHREVADALEKSVVAVRQIQVRGLRALQSLMSEDGTETSVKASDRDFQTDSFGDGSPSEEATTRRHD